MTNFINASCGLGYNDSMGAVSKKRAAETAGLCGAQVQRKPGLLDELAAHLRTANDTAGVLNERMSEFRARVLGEVEGTSECGDQTGVTTPAPSTVSGLFTLAVEINAKLARLQDQVTRLSALG